MAAAYDRARPGYPREAVVWLTGEQPRRVLDLGAGTGKLTRELVELGHDVVAVEPSPEMAEWLRAAAPELEIHRGAAEAIPLPGGSVDAVVAGQAYHWFDPSLALPEIARVLRPNGTLGLIWNMRDNATPWVARLSTVIGDESRAGDSPAATIDASGLFGPVETARFRLAQRLDRETLLALVASRSRIGILEPSERAERLARVGRIYDEEADEGGLRLPYVTLAYRTQRL